MQTLIATTGLALAVLGGRVATTDVVQAPTNQAAAPLPRPAAAVEPAPSQEPAAEIQWRTDERAAVAEAAQTGRPLLVYVTQEGCRPCVQVEAWQRVPNIVRWHRHFVPLRLHVRDAAAYSVTRTPTVVVVHRRREIGRFGTPRNEVEYAKLLQAAYLAAKEPPQ